MRFISRNPSRVRNCRHLGRRATVRIYAQRFEQRLRDGIPNIIDLVAQIYARGFSEDDLSSLLAFYRSPAGQHRLAKQVLISRAMVVLGQDWGKSIGQQVIAEMAKDKAAKTAPKL